MKLKRVVVPKPPPAKKQGKDRSKQAAQSPAQTGGDTMISQHAPGLGFDFNPSDPNMSVDLNVWSLTYPSLSRYLVSTEEGLIHKCSCSYNEQVLETYKGHTVCPSLTERAHTVLSYGDVGSSIQSKVVAICE